jgi:hypothetical protein
MYLKDFKVGDWIFDNEGELKQIISSKDGNVVYTDGTINTTAGYYTKCWELSVRNLVLSKYLQSQKDRLKKTSAFSQRLVREKFYDFTERLFELPYGKKNISKKEIKKCDTLYKEIEDYVEFIIKQNDMIEHIKKFGYM